MNTNHAIEVIGLRKVFAGGIEAVAGIDFSVSEGEVFSLLGPNGAGEIDHDRDVDGDGCTHVGDGTRGRVRCNDRAPVGPQRE